METPILTGREREALGEGRWFARLPAELRHDILRKMQVRRIAAGARICEHGEQASEWIGCASGLVKLTSTTPRGRARTMDYIGPGEWFGETPLLDEGSCTHDAIAVADATLVCVCSDEFRSLLTEHAGFGAALLRLQARRLRRLYEWLELEPELTVRTRLSRALLTLVHRHGSPGAGPGETLLNFRLPQEELAQYVGASRQRINHELKQLERQRVVRSDGRLLVAKADRLRQICS